MPVIASPYASSATASVVSAPFATLVAPRQAIWSSLPAGCCAASGSIAVDHCAATPESIQIECIRLTRTTRSIAPT